jgi:hypothetical protein
MSDRPARPEWRAAFLNRTLPRRALRNSASPGAPRASRAALVAPRPGAARSTDATVGSFPLSLTAMLHPVPTA